VTHLRAALSALAIVLFAFPGIAAASGLTALSDPAWTVVPEPTATLTMPPLRVAQAEGGMDEGGNLRMHAGPDDEEPWHAPWLTGNKLHQYLGIGSLLAAGLAAVTAPEGEDEGGGGGTGDEKGFHHYAGWTAAGLAGAAVGTGLVFHLDDIRLRDGFLDPDNLHALLGILATTAYFVAVTSAPDTSHAGMGIAGAAAMLISIKLAW
jgi:hypothetical protein